MTYDTLEASPDAGRPLFLYRFTEAAASWRFADRATDWTTPAEAIEGEPGLVWTASAVTHGNVVQSSDPRRVDLAVTFPISDAFARRYLGPRSGTVTTLTIYRGHAPVPAELVAWWKGRVVSARTEGERILLRCESLFTGMRREGVRARYQRLCRHALYAGGCRLDIEAWFTAGTASARAGLQVTVVEAAARADGWYRGGVLRHAGLMGFIVRHAGHTLTLSGRMPELEAAIDAAGPAAVEIAPGCDLRPTTCQARFGNLPNFGGFPDIPGRNPFGGSSIV